MLVSALVDNIQYTLADKGVYRTDTFVLSTINHGQKLVAVLSMFDERRSSISISGSRNMVSLPATMLVPIFIANTTSGNRVNPVRLNEMEFYSSEWEGVVEGADVEYYTVLNPHHDAEIELWCVPIPTTGTVDLSIVGAYVPADLTATSTPRLPEAYQDLLYLYGCFAGFVSEPGRTQDAGREYGKFVARLNGFVASLRSRFPSGYLFRPQPIEFNYEAVTRQQQKESQPKQEQANEG
jgi:hypothetical protein